MYPKWSGTALQSSMTKRNTTKCHYNGSRAALAQLEMTRLMNKNGKDISHSSSVPNPSVVSVCKLSNMHKRKNHVKEAAYSILLPECGNPSSHSSESSFRHQKMTLFRKKLGSASSFTELNLDYSQAS